MHEYHINNLTEWFKSGTAMDDITLRYFGAYLDAATRYEAVLAAMANAGADLSSPSIINKKYSSKIEELRALLTPHYDTYKEV